jgi:hypothetical protein
LLERLTPQELEGNAKRNIEPTGVTWHLDVLCAPLLRRASSAPCRQDQSEKAQRGAATSTGAQSNGGHQACQDDRYITGQRAPNPSAVKSCQPRAYATLANVKDWTHAATAGWKSSLSSLADAEVA